MAHVTSRRAEHAQHRFGTPLWDGQPAMPGLLPDWLLGLCLWADGPGGDKEL